MDILYYSNYCKHCQKIIQFLSKGGLLESINAYCIDKRRKDSRTNQTMIILENGGEALLPPNIHSVPALLLTKKNYQVVLGDEIIQHFEPTMQKKIANANLGNGEPLGFSMNSFNGSSGSNIVSEQFTYYNMTPEELSAKGRGGQRQMYNYVSASQDLDFIQTPPDNYRPDKLDESVTLDQIQEQRNSDVPSMNQAPLVKYNTMDF
jgi:hypothetical protein